MIYGIIHTAQIPEHSSMRQVAKDVFQQLYTNLSVYARRSWCISLQVFSIPGKKCESAPGVISTTIQEDDEQIR